MISRSYRRCIALSLVALSAAAVTAIGAARDFGGDVDNNANVWHANPGSCTCVSLGGNIPFALYNNIQAGTNRTLFVRVRFSNGTVSGGASWPSSVSTGTKNIATSVLANRGFVVEGMSNVSIPTFNDTRFRGTISNIQ